MSCGQDGGEGEPVIQFSGRWAPNSPHGWGAGPGFPETGGQRGPDGAEGPGWNHESVEGVGKRPLMPQPTGPSERGTETRSLRGPESHRGASRCVCLPQEDVGWWRSWLQQSYQAVKEKVNWASAASQVEPRHLPATLFRAYPAEPCGLRASGTRLT